MTTFTTLIVGYKAAVSKATTFLFLVNFIFKYMIGFILGGGIYDEIIDFFLL
jgi:hypothetical protein